MEIPVVIAHHYSAPSYLKYSLTSAANFNSKVVLIGDEANQTVWDNHWDSSLVQPDKYCDFLESYVKMSDYSKDYEISFWKRMFLVEEWMKTYDAQKVFLLDSDIVSFVNYEIFAYSLLPKDCIAALVIPQKQDNYLWVASTHCSYWTLEGIEAFTSFCINAYKTRGTIWKQLEAKYQWHCENKAPGGVSEMTLLYLWSYSNSRVYNFAQVTDGMAADHSITSANNYYENEYLMRFGAKQLVFKNGIPYGYNTRLDKEVKFFCLHCQGDAKSAMRLLANQRLRKVYYVGTLIGRTRAKIGAQKTMAKRWIGGSLKKCSPK